MILTMSGMLWGKNEWEYVRTVREVVFVGEQQLPIEEEFDAIDEIALHTFVLVDGHPAATGRLFAFEGGGRIGRMAVVANFRKLGLGRLVIDQLLVSGRQMGWKRFVLDAQVQAIGFYERCGFTVIGEEHLDCGIPHRMMERLAR